MKLVEILARELEVWPEDAQELGQWPGREVCIRAAQVGMSAVYVFTASHAAEDCMQAWVTRPQWQAERDRMKAMGTQQATASTEPAYEQQLWDSVAERALSKAMGEVPGRLYDVVQVACNIADAFMAERAKRVGK